MSRLTIMKLTFVFYIILFLSCFFEATNPLDSAYQGSYNFESTDTLPSELEVLKDYRIHFKNNGTDKYWKFYCSFNPPPIDISVVRSDSSAPYADTGSICLAFKKVYDGKITLIAEQPNRTRAEIPLRTQDSVIHVVNPYSIEGPRLAGIGDSVFLKILYKGEKIMIAGSDSVIISNTKSKNLLSDNIPVTWDFKTSIDWDIKIKRNNDTFNFPLYTISYKGYSPRINQFSGSDTNALTLGGKATFSVKIRNESYSGNHFCKITSGTTVLSIDTLNYDSTTTQVLTVDTLKDTLYSKIMLTVSNEDSLTDTMSFSGLNVYPVLPVIDFRDSSTTVEKDSAYKVDIAINESFGKDSFYWSFHNVKDSVTTTPFITIPPVSGVSDTVSVYVKRAYNFGEKNFEYRSDTLTKVFHPKEFKYKIEMKSIERTQIVAKSIDTFQVCVTIGGVPVPDTSLVYSWIFPPSIDTNYVKISPRKPIGSGFILTVMDSVKLPIFYFSVNAKLKNGTDSTALLKRDIIVRNYRPSLTLIPPLTATTLMQNVSFEVSDSNDVVSMVYYKFSDTAVSDDKSIKTAAPQSKKFILYFKRNGTATVKAWAVDASGFVSDTAVVKFDVKVVIPQFPIQPDTVEATIGVAKTLHARLAPRLDSIIYYWDRNGNGIYKEAIIDTTTTNSDSIRFIPLDATPDTLFVQCQNKDGVSASNPYTIIVVARKNEPVIDTLRVDATAKYKNDPLRIKASVSDLDSNLVNVKITVSINNGVDSLLCDSTVRSPYKKCDLDITKQNNPYGIYKFTVTATDSKGNISTSVITDTLLRGDPIVDSVNVTSQVAYFVKKKVKVTIGAHDPNAGGSIDSVQFIKSNDSSVIISREWLDPGIVVHTFNDSILPDTGLQNIRVRVVDNEGNRSAITSASQQIRVLPHVPLIDSMHCPDTEYIKKDIPDTIFASDPYSKDEVNNLRYYVSLNDTLNFNPLSSNIIKHRFDSSGLKKFFVKVMDPEGYSTVRPDSILILDGKPVFLSGINQNDTFWINDINTFKFKCSDPDGIVEKVKINWGDGDSSSTPVSISNGEFTFNKIYRNSNKKDSTYRITITLTDNYGNTSTAFDSITIRQGIPIIKTSTETGTLFGKYNSSLLTCTLSVKAVDTNGTIVKYYWYFGNAATISKSGVDSTLGPTYIRSGVNNSFENTYFDSITVFARDDDTNIVRKVFPLYIDGPPQIPLLLDPINGSKSFANSSTVTFEWTGHDVHDSLNTKFSIYVRIPGSTTYTLIPNPAITVNMVGTVPHFKYNYTGTVISGSYLWRVVATDQLGSETSSDNEIGNFSILP